MYTGAPVTTDDCELSAFSTTDGAVVCTCSQRDAVTKVRSRVLTICRGANHHGEDVESCGLRPDAVEVVVAAAHTTAQHRVLSERIARKQ